MTYLYPWKSGVFVFRDARRRRWERILTFAIAPFGGSRLHDVHAVVAWLDRHWAGGVPYDELFAGPCYSGAELSAHGHPVCVIANPVGTTEDYPGLIAIRVGVWLTAPDARHPSVVAAQGSFAGLGATLGVERAGIVVRFDQAATDRIARGSGAQLTGAIGSAVELASRLRQS